MKTRSIHLIFVLCLLLVISGCSKVAITGRSQFNIVPDSMINSMALQEYNTFLGSPETKLSTDAQKTAIVKRVGSRIAGAVERYMKQIGKEDQIKGYAWEFNLVESSEINAWAMPGGKVVVYTGILGITQGEDGLAVVMGHEIAHAIARHGAERMSQTLATTAGGIALNKALEDESEEKRQIFLSAYGIGTSLGIILPYSRTHETEADRLGLIFMAMAGYEPGTAVDFWTRMSTTGQGGQVPEFLSTHPAHETRIRNIKSFLPEARGYYQPAP